MISDDGVFELAFEQDGMPGVFVPSVAVVRGSLSPAALLRFQGIVAKWSARRADAELRTAVKCRLSKPGRKNGPLVVSKGDFGAKAPTK
jgi:hypothetical protein